MSKLETPMIEKYWEDTGGTLIEEFLLVSRSAHSGPRRADAVIIPSGVHERIQKGQRNVNIEGKDVIVVQAKAHRLGMSLMGQGIFSYGLINQLHKPKSVRSVILCTQDDATLKPFLESFSNIEVRVMEEYAMSKKKVAYK
jgi:hypothetical protein